MKPAPRLLFAVLAISAISAAQDTFAPFDQWKAALASNDPVALRSLYSVQPPARIILRSGQTDVDHDLAFWAGLKIKGADVELLLSGETKPGIEQVAYNAKIVSAENGVDRVVHVTGEQVWQKQGDQWRLVATQRTDATRLETKAAPKKDLYPETADAHAEIKEAMADAKKNHKNVLVIFGANWCYDCRVLDLAFHRDDLAPVVEKNYEVVHVDIGEGDKNQDLMKQYDIPMEKGIPAAAVLDADGKLLYSQKGGEFEKARSLGPEAVLAFLNKWKPS
jgi:thiol-disulfide isomerase/thioredoxin